jgi:hypothetical protein
VRLQIFGLLVIAATLQLSVYSQQQAPATIESPDGSAEAQAQPQHTVTPPKVSCKGNTLSISANYSALGAILSEIQKCTGVKFDAPEMARTSLVFDELGPGPANDVVASLLTASGFDYIIGASATDPEKIENIVLLTRADQKDAGSADMKGASPARRAFAQMREAARPHTPEEQAAAAAELERSDADAQAGSAGSEAESTVAKPDSPNPAHSAEGASAQAPLGSQDPAVPPKTNTDQSSAATAEAVTSPAPPAPDPTAQAKPSSANDDRIANMQMLFEQRRQMMQQQQQSQHPAPQ